LPWDAAVATVFDFGFALDLALALRDFIAAITYLLRIWGILWSRLNDNKRAGADVGGFKSNTGHLLDERGALACAMSTARRTRQCREMALLGRTGCLQARPLSKALRPFPGEWFSDSPI
jgi:hypothetical protein